MGNTMKREIVSVTFSPTGNKDIEKSTRIVVPIFDEDGYEFDSEYDAKKCLINKAVEKLYGRRCQWWDDNGLGIYYGQVMQSLRPTKNNSDPGCSSQTNKMVVDIS